MKNHISLLVNILLIFIMAACTPVLGELAEAPENGEKTPSPDRDANTVVFTPGIGPNQATLQVGVTLLLQIPTIPEEGFVWVVNDLDTNILVQEGKSLYISNTAADSAGGTVEFRFKAVGVGETTLSLSYVQEDGEFSKDTFGMTVTVGDGESKTIVVIPSATGNSATLAVGDKLVIEIPTLPEEGSQWTVADLDTSILTQIGEAEFIADPDKGSAGGIFRFQFNVVDKGTTSLNFEYVEMSENTSESFVKDTLGISVVVE